MSQKYDAIVIGTGISGGWAAKELCESGLKTLVLERGRMVKHVTDYPTMFKENWDFKYRNRASLEDAKRQEKQGRTGYTTAEEHRHWFVDDIDHPYSETKRFDWMRGYHVGGRSITWGRHSYRLSEMDFEANKKDGYGVDWPIRYKDIEPWYDRVEEYIGVSGTNLGLSQLPDGKFTEAMEFNCVEADFAERVADKMNGRVVTHGRIAHITGDKVHEGRGKCQFRNRCMRGCPYGGYFSSNSTTLPAAERTGNMTMRPNSIVYEIVYDEAIGKASGVRIIDAETKERLFFEAEIIFCCASAIASTSILMQSKSKRFPNGLGNDSGELGHNIMDHHLGVGAYAIVDEHQDDYYKGRRPGGMYIPRFRNLDEKSQRSDYVRGYGYQGAASRRNWRRGIAEMSFGESMKEELVKPGPWVIGITGFGECLPYHENKITLNYDKPDQWGLPTVDFDVEFKENERKMRVDIQEQAVAMLKAAGYEKVQGFDNPNDYAPGLAIHEMGGARMGRDPKTSVLNEYNQVHEVKNVYVTDGACMTSSGCQNPSLTYMALTARAADHAAREFNKNKNKKV
ncbi:GMC oxidoreductase [Lutimonas zeaxanthinifaciens]|uniref:GMC oxidoreductase n=1 Tax=Lutimonas zeaxanthinifaciens TaxID=3060215 RepID=UPI00265CC419|nr:GMC family oxidoreductase [Lutimonas sp. YSD2104]WKK66889.1 GMC family oxidoreductase [Lutimonas sp. YSD2104]